MATNYGNLCGQHLGVRELGGRRVGETNQYQVGYSVRSGRVRLTIINVDISRFFPSGRPYGLAKGCHLRRGNLIGGSDQKD